MRIYFTALLTLISFTLWAQQDTTAKNSHLIHTTYKPHSVIATMSLGFMDDNRKTYSVPPGFTKGVVTGFIPFFAKLEYGLTDHIGVAATFCYDAFIYNIQQNYTGNNGPVTRYKTNSTRIFTGGITGFYHLNELIHVKRLDPFVGLGLCLNNIRYSEFPQGDSTSIKFEHIVTLYLKAGARYYISDRFSLFGDIGYDRQSYLTIGASCRFYHKRPL